MSAEQPSVEEALCRLSLDVDLQHLVETAAERLAAAPETALQAAGIREELRLLQRPSPANPEPADHASSAPLPAYPPPSPALSPPPSPLESLPLSAAAPTPLGTPSARSSPPSPASPPRCTVRGRQLRMPDPTSKRSKKRAVRAVNGELTLALKRAGGRPGRLDKLLMKKRAQARSQAVDVGGERIQAVGDLRVAGTGWGGVNEEVGDLGVDGYRVLPKTETPVVGRTAKGDVLFARAGTAQGWVLRDLAEGIKALDDLQRRLRLGSSNIKRAVLLQLVLGWTRAYDAYPRLTDDMRHHFDVLHALFNTPPWLAIIKHMNNFTAAHFPSVYERYQRANHPDLIFGVFSLCAVNLPAPGRPVSTRPHRDWKNPAGGVCVILPFGDFKSDEQGYVVLHELRLVVEVPAGVAIAFPSALITHSNIDVVVAGSKEEARQGKGRTRGSIVLFSQANLVAYYELDERTIGAAKKAGDAWTSKAVHSVFRQ